MMRRQVMLLSGLSALFTGIWLFRTGTGCVTWTYAHGAKQVFSGLSPYLSNESCDWFKYSPLFAFFYGAFAWLPSSWQALLWGMSGILLYWVGISSWFRFSKDTPPALWLALMICSMELDGSTRYQQVNSHLIGLTLIALARYRDERFFESGIWLALATNFKILPGVFFLLLPGTGRFWQGALTAAGISLILPMAWVGVAETVSWHAQWFSLVLGDVGAAGLADIQSMLGSLGLFTIGQITRFVVLGITVAFVIAGRFWRVNLREASSGAWIALLLSMVLLVSPRTESPTFVIAAPSMLFLARAIGELPRVQKRFLWPLLGVSGLFMTFIYNDIWRGLMFRVQTYAPKSLGVLLLWLVALVLVARQVAFQARRLLLQTSVSKPL